MIVIVLREVRRLRKLVLGSMYPINPVLTQAAVNAVKVTLVIITAGAFLAIVPYLSPWDLVVIGPLIPAGFYFLRKSNYYAAKVDWPSALIEKPGRLQRSGKVEFLYRVLSNLAFAIFIGAGGGAVLFDLHLNLSFLPQTVLLNLVLDLLLVVGVLGLATLILYYPTRTVKGFDFDGTFPQKPPENQPI